MMLYVIKAAITLALLYSCFFIFLSKETFHRFNRCMLVGIMLVSLVMPMFHFTTSHPTTLNEEVYIVQNYIEHDTPPIIVTAQQAQGITWIQALTWIYLAGVVLMLILTFSESRALQSVTWWMMGNLSSAEPLQLAVTGACAGVAAVVLLAQARKLNALVLGADYARTLGVRTERVVPLVLGAASLATAAAVSLAGVIGFVGLMIPHVIRILFGTDHKRLLPLSALLGAVFLIWADVACRVVIPRSELPLGILVSAIGAPSFVWLLVRKSYGFGGAN